MSLPILVMQYGTVWRLTPRNYKVMLQAIIAKRGYNLGLLGTHVGAITCEPLDMTPEEAEEQLTAFVSAEAATPVKYFKLLYNGNIVATNLKRGSVHSHIRFLMKERSGVYTDKALFTRLEQAEGYHR